VDYSSGDQVAVPANPDFPIQIAGQAVLDDGLVIGAVGHQFRDVDGAMEALLTVEFPRCSRTRWSPNTAGTWPLSSATGSTHSAAT